MPIRKILITMIIGMLLVACDGFNQPIIETQFGDQHFKTSIALIELHKVRTGDYPAELSDLQYIGDWDTIAFSSVEYKKLTEGYELNVIRGWVGTPELSYDPNFWQGLGLKQSNVQTSNIQKGPSQ